MWKTFIGNFISDIKTGVGHKNLTLSNTKRETDLGMLVVPFDQTFHPLHIDNILHSYFISQVNDLTSQSQLPYIFSECVHKGKSAGLLLRTFFVWL